MKKNFLKIAALLIAAMLLVVSCSQEVKAPENDNNGLVAVTLNTSVASKGLTFDGLKALEGLTYKFYLDALWDQSKVDEAIVGETTADGKVFTDTSNISLGYLSQGYWNIKVEATKDGKVVLSGETNQYITKTNNTVTVFLNVAGGSTTCTLSFDINVNDLAVNNGDYDLFYSIAGTAYDKSTVDTGEVIINTSKTTVQPAQGEKPTYVTNYKGSKTGLKPGYYRVTVALKNGGSVIGAITRGFLLIDGDEAVTIKGSVSASDFAASKLNVITAAVGINNVTAKVKDTTTNLLSGTASAAGLYSGTVECGSNNNVTVVYSLTPSINIQGTNGVTEVSAPKYTWMVDGRVATDNDNDDTKLTIEYTPGDRYVTCIVTYTYKYSVGQSTGEFAVSNEAYTYLQVHENGYVAPSN